MLGVACRHSKAMFLKLLGSAVDEFCLAGRLQRQAAKQSPVMIAQFLEKL